MNDTRESVGVVTFRRPFKCSDVELPAGEYRIRTTEIEIRMQGRSEWQIAKIQIELLPNVVRPGSRHMWAPIPREELQKALEADSRS